MVAFASEEGSVRQAVFLMRIRAKRYREVARLVFSDSLWRFRHRLSLLLLATGLSLGLQAAALGVFIFYARRLESGVGIQAAGISVTPANSVGLLAATIIMGGAMIVLSSFLKLYVERGFFDITWRYGVYCCERMLYLVSETLNQESDRGIHVDYSEIRQLVTTRPVFCSRVLNMLVNLLPNVARALVFSAFLLYLDPALTLAVLAVVLLSSVFFYGLSVHASTLIAQREEAARGMSGDLLRLIDFMRVANQPVRSDDPLVRQLVREGSFADFFQLRFRPRVLTAKSTHVGTIMLAGVLMIVGLVKGGSIIATNTGYGDLIVFLIAGRQTMASVSAIMNALVRINLYYPRVAGYFRRLEELRSLDLAAAPSEERRPGQTFEVAARPLGTRKPDRELRLLPGHRLAVISPRPIDRFALVGICRCLRIVSDHAGVSPRPLGPAFCRIAPDNPIAGVSFATLAGLSDNVDAVTLARQLAELGLPAKAISTLPIDLAAPMDEAALHLMAPGVLTLSAIVAASSCADHPLIAVSAVAMRAVDKRSATAVFDRLLADRVVLICHQPGDAAATGEFGAQIVLLHDGNSCLGYLPIEEIISNYDFICRMEKDRKSREILADDSLDDDG